MHKRKVKIVNKSKNELPFYGTEFSAGFDLKSDFSRIKDKKSFLGDQEAFTYDSENKIVTLQGNGGRILIPTGIFVAIPDGHEIQVRARSGLALNYGITVLNGVGTIDSDFRGEVCIILINTSRKDFIIKEGERLAQGVLCEVKQANWIELNSVDELGETVRGDGGFGHTGKK